jgi:FkbM family methyltransferase
VWSNINVGNRSKAAVLRAPLQRGHYRALTGMVLRYPRFVENLRRFLTAKGEYPYACRVRTPTGVVAPMLYTSHDISTVNEVFCRQDYRAGRDLGVAVDIGANIGISGLYFLTRNHSSRVYLFEPDPKNTQRLARNLFGYEDRYVLEDVAVGLQDGQVSFGTEPTGRYGRISQDYGEVINVWCRHINAVLADVLEREARIDVLKIDVEGLEPQVVAAVAPEHLARIGVIYYETDDPTPLHTAQFRHRFECQTNRLQRMQPSAGGSGEGR